jgi:hypothetical protein
MKSETSCTANDITRLRNMYLGRMLRRMSDQGPPRGKSTLLVISGAFAVVFSRMNFIIRYPLHQMSLPEVYDNGPTILQLLFEDIRLCQIIHGIETRADQQSRDQCPGGDEHVQNEVHALLICQDHRVCELRKHFSFLFTPLGGDV